jgi:hypothetical protein
MLSDIWDINCLFHVTHTLPTCPSDNSIIDDGNVEHWWNGAERREQIFAEVQLCPQQISRGLTLDRTLSSAVRGWQLAARTTARTVEV